MTTAWILGRGGLLGSAISRACRRNGRREFVSSHVFRWEDASTFREQLRSDIETFLKSVQDDAWEIHWAAGSGTMGSNEDELRSETEAFRVLLDLLGACPPSLLSRGVLSLASSAGAVYAGSKADVISENTEVAPVNPYGHAKLAQESMAEEFSKRFPTLTVVVARYANLYGADQSSVKRQGLLTHIARSILKRTPIHIFVPFDTIRDYVHVDDAAATLLECIRTHGVTGGLHRHIVASEEPVSVAEIIGTFKRLTRVSPRVVTSASPLGASYAHRMVFRSTNKTSGRQRTPLLVGAAEIMRAERLRMVGGSSPVPLRE